MHFSTPLYLFGFLALGAAFPEGASASHSHQRFHRRRAQVDGVVPAGVTPARVEPAVVEPATVEGPPNDAVVDVPTPPNNALVTPISTTTDVIGNQTLVPTTLETIVKVSEGSTLLTSLSVPLPTSEVYVVPTTGGTHEVSSGDGVAPTTVPATGKTVKTVVSSMPLTIITSGIITTGSAGVATSTEGGPVSNSSSTSSPCAPTTIDTPSTSPSTKANATATSFSAIASGTTIGSVGSTPVITNTTISSTSRYFLTATSTSTLTAAWSSSMKITFKLSTPAVQTPTKTTYKLTFTTPSAPAVASQSNGLSMAEFNKTKPCFDKKCDDPGSEMTYNKTVTFSVDNGGGGGVRLGRGPDVASVATGGRGDGALRIGMAVAVVGVGVVLAAL